MATARRRNQRTALEIVPPPADRREEMIDLIAKVFSRRGYYAFRDDCRKGYIHNSHYDWATKLIRRFERAQRDTP